MEIDKIAVTAISDLHGYTTQLPGGDILIIGGDWTARDKQDECFAFFDWIAEQPYEFKILIAGNHDNAAERETYRGPIGDQFIYLCDSGCEIEGIKFYGTPWTKRFKGQNPHAMAFALNTDEELAEKWAKIPRDIDVLITHSPPFGILDKTLRQRTGCKELLKTVREIKPLAHIFGHIHECGGKKLTKEEILFINASYVNEFYEPTNKPVNFEFECCN